MIERSVRFSDGQYEVLKEIADESGLSISYLVRIAIRRLIEEYSEGVDVLRVDPSDLQLL